jgi:hypothetical protein
MRAMVFLRTLLLSLLLMIFSFSACKKSKSDPVPEPPPTPIAFTAAKIDNSVASITSINYNTNQNAVIRLYFTNAVDKSTVAGAIAVKENAITPLTVNFNYENADSTVIISSTSPYNALSKYAVTITTTLKSSKGKNVSAENSFQFNTKIDSTNKFPVISDDALLDTIQKTTFRDYGHPISGLARERSNASPETVTSGGSGFGIMAIPIAISRNFITRQDGLVRMQKIVGFLKNTAIKVKGAFPHWLNGTTGAIIPFSANDDGADLVETSYLLAGLLATRQYFNGTGADEITLRNDINDLWNGVEWDWFRNGNQNQLYWHYSTGKGWVMNFRIRGWNECLITYILSASSPTHSIPKIVYDNGWANNGSIKNTIAYQGYTIPLGEASGGPLFFSHYSFLGINPNGLSDVYANYQTQTTNHTKINFEYCKTNPKNNFGYSNQCWGLTASDIQNGYTASSPTNDVGVIAPTAALSSFPYAPVESMDALKFFYYKLGDKIWGQYGFVDAFSLKDLWYANSHLAIDQGPIIIMIENYRTGLIWNLLTSCPEIKNGMKNVLGFSAPYL